MRKAFFVAAGAVVLFTVAPADPGRGTRLHHRLWQVPGLRRELTQVVIQERAANRAVGSPPVPGSALGSPGRPMVGEPGSPRGRPPRRLPPDPRARACRG